MKALRLVVFNVRVADDLTVFLNSGVTLHISKIERMLLIARRYVINLMCATRLV